MKFRFLSLFLIAVFLSFGVISTDTSLAASADIFIETIPANPNPDEDVLVTLSSYTDNLDTVPISWFINGKALSSGVGKKSFSLRAPKAGSTTTVSANISLPEGIAEKSVVIRPSTMALLWQANDSYAPPFYKGKALPSLGSEIKVVAMPEIKNSSGLVNSKNLVYSWQKNYENSVEDSGYGKNFMIYTGDYLDDSNNVGVTVSTIDGKYSASGTVDMPTLEPKIVFYTNDAVYGTLWERALADTERIDGSGIITAVPYFISPKELLHPSLIWNWFINDSRISISGSKKNSIPLQVQTGVTGISRLRLNIENKDKIFQTANKEINIEF